MTLHACPLHPAVQQEGPGDCPACGMHLEPLAGRAAGRAALRAWVCLALTLPLLALGFGWVRFPQMAPAAARWAELALAAVVVGWGGWPVFVRAACSVAKLRADPFIPLALGLLAAFAVPAVATAAPAVLPADLQAASHTTLGFWAAAGAVTLVVLGHALELRARAAIGGSLRTLLDLQPTTARILQDGQEREVPAGQVAKDSRLQVRAGDRIAADGRVEEGMADVDESMLTGQPRPVAKRPGDRVLAGTRSAGDFRMAAERVGPDTLLQRMAARALGAQRSRGKVQRAAGRTAAIAVPLALALAALAFAAWMALGSEPRAARATEAAVAVLLAGAPAAIALAAPASMTVTTGRALSLGVLFRDADALERLREADTVILDKTGTLTVGRLRLHAIYPAAGVDEKDALRLAAAVEQWSPHPIAQAVAAAAPDAPQATGFRDVPGQGVVGIVEGRKVVVGHRFLVSDEGASVPLDAEANAASMRRLGLTVLYLAVDGELWGVVGIADTLKPDVRPAVLQLRDLHLQVRLISGDNATTANAVANHAAIREVDAGVLPDSKALVVGRIQGEGRKVALCGDGAADAAAMAAAHVGVAMGVGPGATRDEAGVTVVASDVGGIGRAVRLARLASANLRQNLGLAIGASVVGVVLASGALQPVGGPSVPPLAAAGLTAAASLAVLGNALRLGRTRLSVP